jgi:hypothetical protein
VLRPSDRIKHLVKKLQSAESRELGAKSKEQRAENRPLLKVTEGRVDVEPPCPATVVVDTVRCPGLAAALTCHKKRNVMFSTRQDIGRDEERGTVRDRRGSMRKDLESQASCRHFHAWIRRGTTCGSTS